MRRALIILFLLIVLGYVNYLTFATERQIARGTTVFLELVQQDESDRWSNADAEYVWLRYVLMDDLAALGDDTPERGQLVLVLDDAQIGRFSGQISAESFTDLAPNQLAINYTRASEWDIDVGPTTYAIQEGTAALYEAASYAEVRITADGRVFLVALHNDALQRLGPDN